MQHYEKGNVQDVPDEIPLNFREGCIHMKVSYGSKVKNLLGFALKKIKEPGTSQISWSGHGKAFFKTISCAETFMKKVKGLHRVSNIRYKRTEEYWEPKLEGLERLKVNIDVPAVTILFSKEPVDHSAKEHPAPKELEILLKRAIKDAHKRQNEYERSEKYRPCPASQSSGKDEMSSSKDPQHHEMKQSGSSAASGTPRKNHTGKTPHHGAKKHPPGESEPLDSPRSDTGSRKGGRSYGQRRVIDKDEHQRDKINNQSDAVSGEKDSRTLNEIRSGKDRPRDETKSRTGVKVRGKQDRTEYKNRDQKTDYKSTSKVSPRNKPDVKDSGVGGDAKITSDSVSASHNGDKNSSDFVNNVQKHSNGELNSKNIEKKDNEGEKS